MEKKLLVVVVLFLLSNCESIFIEDISTETVVLLAPSNNSEIANGIIGFNWQELDDAIEYQIQIAKPSFSGASQILLDSISTSTIISKDLEVGEYEWRVKALNSNYTSNYTTNFFSVIDTSFASKKITLLLPLDKDTTNVKNQTLLWQELEGSIEYRVHIWQPDINGTKIIDEAVNLTNYQYDFPEGNFTWQVRGETSSKNTAFSSRTITVDSTIPNTPLLDLPIDNSTVNVNTAIEFKWNRTDVLGTPELDSIYFYSDINLQTLVYKNKGISNQYTKSDFSVGDYFWFVKSFDTAGNESPSSNTHKLTVN